NGTAIPWGAIYPHGIPAGLVFADGFVWGGFVNDGQQPKLRVGGHTYYSGLQTGAIVTPGVAEDPTDAKVNRVWRFRSDWKTADLSSEAFDILVSRPDASSRQFQFSADAIKAIADSLRLAYEKDRQDWPWQKGAPFYDTDHNGVMDENEEPGLLDAAQIVWFVANDLNPQLTQALYGSPPIGIEMQVTLWAYHHDSDIENSIYRRIRLIYKGTSMTPLNATIDSMAIGLYSDIDIGDFADDFGGTDTTLQMIFGYNSTTLDPAYQQFSSSPPALGYALLYGPIVSSTNDIAIFDFSRHKGFRNLPLTMSWIDRSGDTDSNPNTGTYDGTLQYYNVLNGFRPRPINPPDHFRIPATGEPTHFSLTGDPLNATGWLDENPGDRQITFSSGNFNMALGDTQEVVMIMTAGLGADRLASLHAMKFFANKAREFAQYTFLTKVDAHKKNSLPESFLLWQNYPNPFNQSTKIQYAISEDGPTTIKIYNLSGSLVRVLVNETQNQGSHETDWDGKDMHGKVVASGLYFYQFKSGKHSAARRMLLLR
ncbi:MAG: T9SS type A sorting domain-containing protein, partial [bacterium]|nr:T9SS type A sorting domain-containing protein [bacterium]